jgi:dephospho-CoA kinase
MRLTGGVLMVGLTGGIGAGKSVVAKRLAELGAVVIDADRLAREVVAPGTEGLAEVVAAFGPEVLAPDGSLDRAVLARRVFGDDAARRRLEEIIHPRVRARTRELVSAVPPDAVVVNDVPLLVESNLAAGYGMVVVVLADERARLRRLAQDRGMSESESRARIAAQATDEQRRAAADVVLINDGTLDELRAAVDEVWRERMLPRVTSAG